MVLDFDTSIPPHTTYPCCRLLRAMTAWYLYEVYTFIILYCYITNFSSFFSLSFSLSYSVHMVIKPNMAMRAAHNWVHLPFTTSHKLMYPCMRGVLCQIQHHTRTCLTRLGNTRGFTRTRVTTLALYNDRTFSIVHFGCGHQRGSTDQRSDGITLPSSSCRVPLQNSEGGLRASAGGCLKILAKVSPPIVKLR